jgi:cytidylate kinase
MTLVTLSASYGAGGSKIGPELAAALGVPFLDRAIPVAVAQRLAVPLDEALARDETQGSRLDRLLRDFAPAVQVYAGGGAMIPTALEEHGYREATEQVIREHAAHGGGVFLGRAGMVVLLDDPRVLRVRLDGPVEARLAQAMAGEGIDRKTAKRRMKETDGARDAYIQHFYRRDVHDPTLYHLMLDATAFSISACVELIAMAARAHGATIASGGDQPTA